MSETNNMRYYDYARSVPEGALKAFSTGRFTGTDINPMWRIKMLTEMFGPCGIGWYTDVTRQEVCAVDDGNLMVFVDLNLYVKENGEWSKPIFGTGGNTLKVKGRGDDEGYKKAYTDALSIACKALGIGADVWYANDTTSKYSDKYIDNNAPTSSAEMPTRGSAEAALEVGKNKLKEMEEKLKQSRDNATQPQPATQEQRDYIKTHSSDADYTAMLEKFGADLEKLTFEMADKAIKRIDEKNESGLTKCERCDKPITGTIGADGKRFTASELIAMGMEKFGGAYCSACMKDLQKSKRRKAS